MAPEPVIDPRIPRAIAGDRGAAESLVLELMPRVRNLVRYLVRGDSEVDDLAQEALIAILKGLSGFRGEGSLKSWADKVVVRETLGRIKRRRQERSRFEIRNELHPVSDARADVYLARRAAAQALDILPDEQREAIVLHHALELSIPEVAELLGASPDTIKSRIRLGMQKLRLPETV